MEGCGSSVRGRRMLKPQPQFCRMFRPKTIRILFIFLFVWLLLSMACNFPMLAPQGGRRDKQAQGTTNNLSSPALQTPEDDTFVTPLPGLNPDPTSLPEKIPATIEPPVESADAYVYRAQSGDTLSAVASRFGVESDQIVSQQVIPAEGYISLGQVLIIPKTLGETLSNMPSMPDSEVIYSPSTLDFQIEAYIADMGGFLSNYEEQVDGERLTGSQVVRRVAMETSTNPRLLLAFLEYRSGWVSGQPEDEEKQIYPIGFYVPGYRGLYKELSLTAKQLNIGYYGWRQGSLTKLTFPDGSVKRLSPELNAGSVALQFLFSKFYKSSLWEQVLYGPGNFLPLYREMFGDAWERAKSVEPLLAPDVRQPELELPFAPGERWGFTGGPHKSWNTGTPPGALDFSPVTGDPPCSVSSAWVTASASGVVVRSEHDLLTLDLDGDGYEQTGWVLLFLHVADQERVPAGALVDVDDRLGHPSCEGGNATGTHVHIARKYNGEWIPADGPLPFVLSGWELHGGSKSYQGYLVKGDRMIEANPGGPQSSVIVR
jgi:LasA protease